MILDFVIHMLGHVIQLDSLRHCFGSFLKFHVSHDKILKFHDQSKDTFKFGALLQKCRALVRKCRALLRKCRALSLKCSALLQKCAQESPMCTGSMLMKRPF